MARHNLSSARVVNLIQRGAQAPFEPDVNDQTPFVNWEAPTDGEGNRVLTRVSVRVDGDVIQPGTGVIGFPCAVAEVTWRQGAHQRRTLLDCCQPNTLIVWATGVNVRPLWDMKRIAKVALIPQLVPFRSQLVAASICLNDTGHANGRYLDILTPDDDSGSTVTVEVPPYSRAVRYLGSPNSAFGTPPTSAVFGVYGTHVGDLNTAIEERTPLPTVGAPWLVPTNATYMTLKGAPGFVQGLTCIEWLQAVD